MVYENGTEFTWFYADVLNIMHSPTANPLHIKNAVI